MNRIAIPTRERLSSGLPLRRLRIRQVFGLVFCASMLACSTFGSRALAQNPQASPASEQTPQAAASQETSTSGAVSQQPVPNVPEPRQSPEDQRPFQTRRILGVIPNFRAVSTTSQLPTQSVKEKFVTCTQDSFDYSSVFIPAALAAYSLGTTADPEFGGGGTGYSRYLWRAAVDQTIENYMVEFAVPVATHEDTRFYTLENGGFRRRAAYALSRAVITRSDSGREVFNISEVFGAGAAAGLSNLYYPSQERSFENTGKQWGIDVGIDAAAMFVKEFWPDINHHLFHGGE